MQCYNHEINSIAQCKHCLKGLCKDCVIFVDGVSSCKGPCESKNQEYENYIELAKQSIVKASSMQKRMGIFCLIMGVMFIALGLIPFFLTGDLSSLLMAVLGAPFLLGAYFNFKSAREIKRNENV